MVGIRESGSLAVRRFALRNTARCLLIDSVIIGLGRFRNSHDRRQSWQLRHLW
jgi:hypothetical protein